MKYITNILIIALILATQRAAYPDDGGMITISIKDNAKVNLHNLLHLGDIADISGDDAALTEEISRIELLKWMPRDIKEPIYIKKGTISAKIKQNKIDTGKITLNSPDKITIFRDYRTINKDEISGEIDGFLTDKIKLDRERFVVSDIKMETVDAPYGDTRFEIIPKSVNTYKGDVSFYVKIFINDLLWKQINASVFIEEFAEAVVATRYIKKGDIISENDIEIKRINITDSVKAYSSDILEFIGKMAVKDIKAEGVIFIKDVKDFFVIKNGDKIRIVAESESIKVSTLGVAKENGRKGDYIKVLNIGSRKQIMGEVVDDGTVLVKF